MKVWIRSKWQNLQNLGSLDLSPRSSYDPVEEISKLNIPILIIQGSTDIQIQVSDALILHKAAKNSRLEIIEGMNHVFRQASDNRLLNLQTYGNPELPIDNSMVRLISEFIIKK